MRLLILFALFSFLPNEKYEIDKYICENNEIRVYYKENWYTISLFNVFVKEDVCPYLEGNMKIEFDQNIDRDKWDVYVFMDGELLQKKLIEDKVAEIKIENPRYKYDFKEDSKEVIAPIKNKDLKKQSSNSIKWAYVMIVLWIIWLIFYFIMRKRNRKR